MEHKKRLLIGGGMATLLTVGAVVGALTFGPALAQSPSGGGSRQPGMTAAEAEAIALAAYPGAVVVETDFDQEDGARLYSVDLDNGIEVSIDPDTGAVTDTQLADTDEDEEVDGADEDEELADTDEDTIEEEIVDEADDEDGGATEDDEQSGELDDDSITADTAITLAQAEATALDLYPDAQVVKSDLDNEDGTLVFSVELDNGMEVKVDAATGAVLGTESDEDD